MPSPLRIFFFPLMWQGHLIPMLDMAKLFALRSDVDVGIIATPLTLTQIQSTVDRHPNLAITIHHLQFPSPPSEALDNVSPTDLLRFLFNLEGPFESLIETQLPDCVLSDVLLPWTAASAAKFDVPRLVFAGTGFFSECVTHSIARHSPHERVESKTEPFLVPNLPHPIELTRSQVAPEEKGESQFLEIMQQVQESRRISYGEIVNSFYELEPDYVNYFKREINPNVWHVGPVSSCNKAVKDQALRGPNATTDPDSCLAWLDSRDPASVLYICFGSHACYGRAQMTELAWALQESGRSFIWVVPSDATINIGQWLPEGFEERSMGRGLIIKGWAPQMIILNHPAVGGFVTHCGWNSILEGVSAGVPMATWPVVSDQFYGQKLVTRVLKIGVEVGSMVSDYSLRGEEEAEIGREKIKAAVAQLMDSGDEGDEMRRRAKELSEMARLATEEGGSSYMDLIRLLDHLVNMRHKH